MIARRQRLNTLDEYLTKCTQIIIERIAVLDFPMFKSKKLRRNH